MPLPGTKCVWGPQVQILESDLSALLSPCQELPDQQHSAVTYLSEVRRHGNSPFTLQFCGCVRRACEPSNLHFQFFKAAAVRFGSSRHGPSRQRSHMATEAIEPRPAENDVANSAHVATIAGVSPNNGVNSSATPVDSTSPAIQPEQIPDGAAVIQGHDAAVRGDTPVPDGRVIIYTE